MTVTDYAESLLNRQPDPFAAVRESVLSQAETHARTVDVASYARARELATVVATARASYVLVVNSGFGYLPLHIVGAFGNTGRVDIVETDPGVATFVEQIAREQSLADRMRVYLGSPVNVISSLSGPYDIVMLDSTASDTAPNYEDLVRLTRTGGSIVITPGPSASETGVPLLDALAADPRMLVSFPAHLSPVIAVRRR